MIIVPEHLTLLLLERTLEYQYLLIKLRNFRQRLLLLNGREALCF